MQNAPGVDHRSARVPLMCCATSHQSHSHLLACVTRTCPLTAVRRAHDAAPHRQALQCPCCVPCDTQCRARARACVCTLQRHGRAALHFVHNSPLCAKVGGPNFPGLRGRSAGPVDRFWAFRWCAQEAPIGLVAAALPTFAPPARAPAPVAHLLARSGYFYSAHLTPMTSTRS